MPPLAPNLSQAATLRTFSGWNNSSMSRRSNTMHGLLSTRTPQSLDTTSGGMLNPPLPPSIIGEAMPRGAAGSFTPRVVLSRPSGGGGGVVLPLGTWANKTITMQGLGTSTTSQVLTFIGSVNLPGNYPPSVDATGGVLNNQFIQITFPNTNDTYSLAYTSNSPQLVLWDPSLTQPTDGFAIIMPNTTPSSANLQFSQIYDAAGAGALATPTFNFTFS